MPEKEFARSRESIRSKDDFLIGRLIPFAIGLFLWVPVRIVGTLPVSELIMLGVSPILFLSGSQRWTKIRPLNTIFALFVLWVGSQVLSDFINNTDEIRRMKGLANLFFISLAFCVFLRLFHENTGRFIPYLFGSFLGGFYRPLYGYQSTAGQVAGLTELRGDIGEQLQVFDIYVVQWASPLVLLIGYFLFRSTKSTPKVVAIFILYGTACAFFSARAPAGMFYFASIFLSLSQYSGSVSHHFSRKLRLDWILAAAMLLATGYGAFTYAGLKGWLGEGTLSQLNACANPYNPYDLVKEGRGTIFLAIEAIKHKPFIGFGYNPQDRRFAVDYGRSKYGDTIAGHSVLLESWVAAGILGAVFWFYILRLACRYTIQFFTAPYSRFKPFLFYGLAALFWGTLLSPMGYARFEWPPYMALFLIFSQPGYIESEIRNRKKVNP